MNSRYRRAILLILLTAVVSVSSTPLEEDDTNMPHSAEDFAADLDDEHSRKLLGEEESLSREQMAHSTIRLNKSGKQDESGEENKSFEGVPHYIQAGHNITRLSHMLHRAVNQYQIQSMVDVPCRSHSRWMGQFLQSIKPNDRTPFAYFCVDSNDQILELAESRIGDLKDVSTDFILRKFWKLPMPKADLVFAWEGLGKMKVKNVKSMLNLLVSGGRHKYLLIGSSPSERNSDKNVLNIRRSPFSYNLPKRIYKELAVSTNKERPEKHMYLYQISEMQSSK